MGYAHAPHEMLRYFLSVIMRLWGLPEWEPVPDDAKARIVEAVDAYAKIVHDSEPFEDIIGPLYMDMASRSKSRMMGQYFTPWEIARMTAMLNAGGNPLERHPQGIISVHDPACGSGVMLMAFANLVFQYGGAAGLLRLSVAGCDLDEYCARIAAVQLIANCNVHGFRLAEVRIVQGDSLLQKNMRLILHGTAPELMHHADRQNLFPENAQPVPANHPHPVQIELFAA